MPDPIRSLTAALLLLTLSVGVSAQEAAKPRHQEVIYGHKDGLAMTFDVFAPEGEPNGAAVVFVVSGGWFSHWAPPEKMRMLLSPFLSEGYTGFAVRHGSSPKYSIEEALSDVRLGVRTIRRDAKEYGIDPNKIGVIGMSAGGHLTLMLATTGEDGNPDAEDPLDRISSRIDAGVAFVPPSDITNYVWSTPDLDPQYRRYPGLDISKEKAKQLSPLYFVTEDDAPCLIVSGGQDTLVLPEQGRWIHEKMDEIGVKNKFIIYEDAGHSLGASMPLAVLEAAKWFDAQLLDKE